MIARANGCGVWHRCARTLNIQATEDGSVISTAERLLSKQLRNRCDLLRCQNAGLGDFLYRHGTKRLARTIAPQPVERIVRGKEAHQRAADICQRLLKPANLGARMDPWIDAEARALGAWFDIHRCGGSLTRSPPAKPFRQPVRGFVLYGARQRKTIACDRVTSAMPADPVKPVSQPISEHAAHIRF